MPLLRIDCMDGGAPTVVDGEVDDDLVAEVAEGDAFLIKHEDGKFLMLDGETCEWKEVPSC